MHTGIKALGIVYLENVGYSVGNTFRDIHTLVKIFLILTLYIFFMIMTICDLICLFP